MVTSQRYHKIKDGRQFYKIPVEIKALNYTYSWILTGQSGFLMQKVTL